MRRSVDLRVWRSIGTKSGAECEHRMLDTACTLESQVLPGLGWSQKRCWARIPSVAGASALSLRGKLVTIHSLTTTVPSGRMTTPSLRAASRNTNVRTWRVESCSACSTRVGGRILAVFLNCSADSIVDQAKAPRFIPSLARPEAWAAGAVFLLVQACLGVSIPGASNRILFDRPYLPDGIPQLSIKGLHSSKGSVDVFCERRNDTVRVEVTDHQGEIEVVATPSAEALNIR